MVTLYRLFYFVIESQKREVKLGEEGCKKRKEK